MLFCFCLTCELFVGLTIDYFIILFLLLFYTKKHKQKKTYNTHLTIIISNFHNSNLKTGHTKSFVHVNTNLTLELATHWHLKKKQMESENQTPFKMRTFNFPIKHSNNILKQLNNQAEI